MNNLNVEYVPIDSIKPYSRNARKHDKKSVEAIKASIKEFGMSDPVGVWKDEIVEGHGRVIACKELGFSEIPIIRLDHLTDEQRRAYALAHNKTAELSAWDFSALDAELDGIFNIDMSGFGFDPKIEFDEQAFEDLFAESPPKETEPKRIQCPHCGEWFDAQ